MTDMQSNSTPATGQQNGESADGPLEVGYYTPSDSFRAITEHIALMRPDGGLIALFGPATDPQSFKDAHLFKAVPALYEACRLALALVSGHSPAVDRALEEAIFRACAPVPGSHGRFAYVPDGETVNRLSMGDSSAFETVASFSEDSAGKVTHVVRRRLSDNKFFEYLEWVGYDTAREVIEREDLSH